MRNIKIGLLLALFLCVTVWTLFSSLISSLYKGLKSWVSYTKSSYKALVLSIYDIKG